MSYLDTLYSHGPQFDFYQAVRLLELLHHDPTDTNWAAVEDIARFRAHQSLNFPPSAIHAIEPPTKDKRSPTVTVNFLGMTGPQGALPTNYTQFCCASQGKGGAPNGPLCAIGSTYSIIA